MITRITNPMAIFLQEKGFQIKAVGLEMVLVGLSNRKLYVSEVEQAIGDNFQGYYIEQSDSEVYILYSEEATD